MPPILGVAFVSREKHERNVLVAYDSFVVVMNISLDLPVSVTITINSFVLPCRTLLQV